MKPGGEPGARNLGAGLLAGLALGAVSFLVFLGMTGQFGIFTKGIRLTPLPRNAPSQDVALWGLAVAATIACATASLRWQQRRPTVHAPLAALVVLASAAVGLILGNLVTWAVIALPMTTAAAALLVVQAVRVRQEPHRKPFEAPLPQLASSALLGLVYGVAMGLAVALS